MEGTLNMRNRVLLALRAGPTESAQLDERYGGTWYPAMVALLRQKLATATKNGSGRVFRLTQAGRAACPARRQIESEPL